MTGSRRLATAASTTSRAIANRGKLLGIFGREVTGMEDAKAQLLRWIDEDRETIIGFLCDFVRAKSPNPPGDTTLAAAHVTQFLTLHKLPFRVIAPLATMPNIVGSFEGGRPRRYCLPVECSPFFCSPRGA
jgi:hypothetical protein